MYILPSDKHKIAVGGICGALIGFVFGSLIFMCIFQPETWLGAYVCTALGVSNGAGIGICWMIGWRYLTSEDVVSTICSAMIGALVSIPIALVVLILINPLPDMYNYIWIIFIICKVIGAIIGSLAALDLVWQ